MANEEVIYIQMPSLIGKLDADAERELTLAFMNIFEHVKSIYGKLGVNIRVENLSPSTTIISRKESEREKENVSIGLNDANLAQRNIGSNVQDPSVEGIIPRDVLSSDLIVTAGAVPVAGKITVRDRSGNSIELLTA